MQHFDAPRVGHLPAGERNLISDVAGVKVGHATLSRGDVQTGVTVVCTHERDPFLFKTPAAAAVINGFGKSIGLLQVDELGVLETPIALTNTFSAGIVATAQIREAVRRHPEIGREWPTVNPLVFECHDGYLNDIQAFAVSQDDYGSAHRAAAASFEQGSVGAGRGMSSFGLKGGIGSASRRVEVGSERYTVGALVLANYGRLPTLTVKGRELGRHLDARRAELGLGGGTTEPEKGSIIIVLATDAPLEARQLQRVSRRAGAGLARTGSVYGHGSGDIAIAFTTAWQVPAQAGTLCPRPALVHEPLLDALFTGAAEATEQAIVNSLWAASSVNGRDGHRRLAIHELLPDWQAFFAGNAS